MDLNEAVTAKNLALKLLTLLEDRQITTMRLKAYVLSLPEAQEQGFSMDELLREDALTADIEQGHRKLYADLRRLIAGFPGSSEKLLQSLEELAATRRSG